MSGRRRLIVSLSTSAVALIAVLSGLGITAATPSTGSGPAATIVSSPVAPGNGVCAPGSARCTPTSPPAASGFAVWAEAVFMLGVVFVLGLLGRRPRRTRVLSHLPAGVHALILRPPRVPVIAL